MTDDDTSLDLFWHALNYRTAGPLEAEAMWQELQACVGRLKDAAVAAERERIARQAPSAGESKQDRGPWSAKWGSRRSVDGTRKIECATLWSDDFDHDVVLYVSGDFADPAQQMAYAEDLARRLSAPAAEVGRDELQRLRQGHERYETARRMNPRQWADAWQLNISTGKRFDDIIDDMRPFMRGVAQK